MCLPAFLVILVFHYFPVYGLIIAFKDYMPGKGIGGSSWVGFEWFRLFFNNPMAFRLFRNTFLLGFYTLLFGFPAPIILALLLNEIRNNAFKKTVQTISYLPHFISTVIIVGLLKEMTATTGLFNQIRIGLGLETAVFFAKARYFRLLFIGSGIWQQVGWGSIIYLAALAGVDVQLYESAIIDGAGRFRQMRYITIPSILPTIIILLLLSVGHIMGADYQKILLMYSPLTYETADVIGTYVYREGLVNARFSYSAAVGLFINVISFLFLFVTNQASKRLSEISLW